ncbi:phosphotransferase family protein [Micromonospora sp. HM5-17]|uniref:phosphotransferase family protein n=1 Tax=Micromonospora sp. HM5-17 TaxID=2487710 RepID=UPI000F47E0D6|nr:phosphotransferase [Micromonospora sp. HM5-17]ROT27073.1 aminoglycoside phosphotransferase family protein [Micromonospora sp. HM5-17]
MAVISVPPRPYDATAVRPGWADLPADLRAAINARLGSRVTWAATAGGGFTRGFAGVVQTAAGDRVFVKAASLVDQRHLSDWYAREVAITAALPAGLPVARPRWTLTAAGYFVVCLDAIEGRMPGLPWSLGDLEATLATYATVADALRDPPAELVALGSPRLADLARADLAWWGELATGRETVPNLPAVARDRLPELAALEARLPGYAESTSMIHGDLRVDNVLVDATGTAWLCDWTWLCFGPAWFDLAGLLVTAYASGLPADRLFDRHPAARTAPHDGLDAALAALAGYWLVHGASPSTGSPHLRAHQRWSGEMALAWLAARRRWG